MLSYNRTLLCRKGYTAASQRQGQHLVEQRTHLQTTARATCHVENYCFSFAWLWFQPHKASKFMQN